jgi:hypothetical protein
MDNAISVQAKQTTSQAQLPLQPNAYGKNTQTLVPSFITCPVGQTAICSPNTKLFDVKKVIESFESVTIKDFIPTLSFVLFFYLFIIIVFLVFFRATKF